jgi:hypothetical protein
MKTRQVPLLAACLVVAWLLVGAVGDVLVPFPNLRMHGNTTMPLTLFLPLLPVAVLTAGLSNVPRMFEACVVRPVQVMDLGLCAAVIAASYMIGPLLGDAGLVAARNTTGYVGVALTARFLVGGYAAAAAPAGFAVSVALLGARPGVGIDTWAWPAAGPDDRVAAVIAAVAAGCGCLLLHRRQTRSPRST